MIQISQKEAEYLRSKNRDNDIHVHSKNHKSRSKRYFLTTSKVSVDLLNDYRRSRHQTDLFHYKKRK